ncbi:MAG: DUF3109 family protein [Cyclobacteriaceae bacterium]|nr:DUF3109 family protein [Cyclobacteriaceae bacterium]
MIEFGKTLISDDVKEKLFACDLNKCKGACCVEGDLGAPLTDEEIVILEEIYDEVKPYLTEEGIEEIEKQGKFVLDEDGEFSTPTIDGEECVYAIYDENLILKCGIEQAYLEGKINYKKPISCHLYPIRITKYEGFEALNYNRWNICKSACELGEKLGVPVFKFLKEPLIRMYGNEWYEGLEKLLTKKIS